jgi:hypothetical protein
MQKIDRHTSVEFHRGRFKKSDFNTGTSYRVSIMSQFRVRSQVKTYGRNVLRVSNFVQFRQQFFLTRSPALTRNIFNKGGKEFSKLTVFH